ncbi:MAG: peptidase family [Betaproteobacteria bacterium]|nr:peptidase family [Betaproteobacteria bacterium]
MARPLFSSSWHNVAGLKPRLIPHAQIRRHVYRGEVWFVVQDESGGRFHRMSAAAHAFILRMNGKTSMQVLWEEACNTAGDDVPTQNEVVDLLIQLHAADLLHADVTPDAAALFERYRKRRNQTWKQWLMNPMSLKIPLIDPDALLTRWAPRIAWVFGPAGAMLWAAIVIPASLLAAQHWLELTQNLSDRVLATGNLIALALVFPLVKLMHELGHGFATKVWGGAVREIGVMFLVFAPVPYVEASASSAFPSKVQRAVVGAAGMLVEVFLAALAMYVWLLTEPGLVRAVAFNVMLIAGVSTVIVNGNPLLRYDGYYIFTDLIEMPNMAQRGQRYLSYLWDRYIFRATEIEPPAESSTEKRWLVAYSILSWCYRLFITITIILFIAGEFFIFGVLLALWGAGTLFCVPVWKAFKHVTESPGLQRQRGHAIRVSLGLLAAAFIVTVFVPMPLRTQADGVVWLPEQALLRTGGNGFFQRWLVAPGTAVTQGTAVAALEDPLLDAELQVARARVDEAQARYYYEQYSNPTKAEVSLRQLEHERDVLARTEERYARLVLYSAVDGTVTATNPQDMPGSYYKKGELVGYVLDRRQLLARVVIPQDNIDLARTRFRSAEMRLADSIFATHPVTLIREMPGGIEELPSAALGPTGGGAIAVDPKDEKGLKTIERVFIFDFQLPPQALPAAFGERVHVRMSHASEPLAYQGYRRLRQLFLSRFNV